MPTPITEDQLTFTFSDAWQASKLDDWQYYRRQFSQYFNNVRDVCSRCEAGLQCLQCETSKVVGTKSCDILALLQNTELWLIEIKDYRNQQRTKPVDLADEVAVKVRDSLAVLCGAAVNANDQAERALARSAVTADRIRIVLHLEQRAVHSRLFPRAIDPASVQQRLKQKLKAIDPHPRVFERNRMDGAGWDVA